MKIITSATCRTLALFAVVALLAVGCATTGGVSGGVSGGKKAPDGSRYVCNCSPDCSCGSNAAMPGNCACGKPMVLKKVLVEKGSAYYMCGCSDSAHDSKNPKNSSECSGGKALKSFPKKGAYNCGCAGCDCDMQANAPGKCTCGNDMKPLQQ